MIQDLMASFKLLIDSETDIFFIILWLDPLF